MANISWRANAWPTTIARAFVLADVVFSFRIVKARLGCAPRALGFEL